uniref:tRNA (guanine-N(7)-)-methyltransferase n=1 Tax=uncultured Rhizobium sp. HF0500_35F13 TaxID=723627 RepID=E7C618_9HYPH|nr:predicted S-adenosylmethionine-dependent methyltransferase [uncultured Rhizobium sp. HF0500_35F13]
MGRRALRRNDAGLELADHLLVASDLAEDWCPEDAFREPAPLEIEVGSGKGLFLEHASADHPQHNFLGIEIARKYARFAAARLARAERENARVVIGDAQFLFARRVKTASLQAVHVYFPDPWWKKRHHKRRMICESFVKDVVRCLKPAGSFHIWTDVREYYQLTLELLAGVAQLSGPQDVDQRPATHDMDYQTHFERRVRLNDEPVYRCCYQRLDD